MNHVVTRGNLPSLERSGGLCPMRIEKRLVFNLNLHALGRCTPSLKGIIIANNGQLIRIDSGISRYYGGPLTWLEIAGDRVTPHTMPRPAGGTP